MTVVTGVSGSGKSTLVRDVFYKALKREYSEASERPGEFISLEGDVQLVKDIEFVDQKSYRKIITQQSGNLCKSIRRNTKTLCRTASCQANGIYCRIFLIQYRRRAL